MRNGRTGQLTKRSNERLQKHNIKLIDRCDLPEGSNMIGMFVNSIDNNGELKFYLKSPMITEEGLPLDEKSRTLAPISD